MDEILYRGTSSGWAGNPVLRGARLTPTTSDPLVATLFGTESARFGVGIVLACRRNNVAHLLGPANALAEIEREVVISVPPLEFTERFVQWIISVDRCRAVLSELGYETPVVIASKRALIKELETSPRLNTGEIEQFNRRLLAGVE